MMRVLLVDDDRGGGRSIRTHLLRSGIDSTTLTLAADGIASHAVRGYDAIVLHSAKPDVDGVDLCTRLRRADIRLPILVVSERRRVRDRVNALNAGVDDYLTKPFAQSELSARVCALVRRGGDPALRRFTVGDLTLDPLTRRAFRGRRRLSLSAKEFDVLEYLVRHAGQPVARAAIAESVWAKRWDPLTNLIDVFVCRLRRKVEAGGRPRLIRTVRGVGYVIASRLDQPGDERAAPERDRGDGAAEG